jgi:isopenicillin-N N-acyltransferase-like protein
MYPIIDESPVFVKSVKVGGGVGKLYTVGKGDDEIYVVHLWGTPYEMGYAHGLLVTERMIGLINTFWTYMEEQVVSF